MPRQPPWSAEMLERGRALWDEGHSAREIARTLAREFGREVSYSGVAGQAHRKKWPIRGQPGAFSPGEVSPLSGRALAEAKALPLVRPLPEHMRPVRPGVSAEAFVAAAGASAVLIAAVAAAKAARAEAPGRPKAVRPDAPPRLPAPAPRSAKPPAPPSARPRAAPLPSLAPPSPPPEPPTVFKPRASCPCRWPLGEVGRPGFRYCDAASAPGKSYCPEHYAIAYTPVPQRRVA